VVGPLPHLLDDSKGRSQTRGMAYDNFLSDKRVVERNIKKGLVDPDELKKQIEALPDRESNLVHVSLEGAAADTSADSLEDDVDDEDDEDDDEDDEDEDEGEGDEPKA
jgi:hypothetical protein